MIKIRHQSNIRIFSLYGYVHIPSQWKVAQIIPREKINRLWTVKGTVPLGHFFKLNFDVLLPVLLIFLLLAPRLKEPAGDFLRGVLVPGSRIPVGDVVLRFSASLSAATSSDLAPRSLISTLLEKLIKGRRVISMVWVPPLGFDPYCEGKWLPLQDEFTPSINSKKKKILKL